MDEQSIRESLVSRMGELTVRQRKVMARRFGLDGFDRMPVETIAP